MALPAQAGVLRGEISGFDEDGFLCGWAMRMDDQYNCVHGSITNAGQVVGRFYACRLVNDLISEVKGHGWYGFQSRIELTKVVRNTPFVLIESVSGSVIAEAQYSLPIMQANEPAFALKKILSLSEMKVETAEGLKGTNSIVEHFVDRFGFVKFVQYSYCYVLGRPPDPDGLQNYVKQLEDAKISPVELLTSLFDSDERRRSSWRVLPPSDPGFPFREALR